MTANSSKKYSQKDVEDSESDHEDENDEKGGLWNWWFPKRSHPIKVKGTLERAFHCAMHAVKSYPQWPKGWARFAACHRVTLS